LSLAIIFTCTQTELSAAEQPSKTKKTDKSSSKKSDVIVEVNGIKLTVADLETDMNSKLELIKSRIPADRIEEIKSKMRDQIVEDFITRTTLAQEAEKHKISVTGSEVDEKIKEIKKSMPEGMTMETALKTSGMSIEKLRKDIEFGLRVNKLTDAQVKINTTLSDKEIKEYYDSNKKKFGTPETVHARHILIKTDSKDDEKTKTQKKAKIEELRKKVLSGADFEKTAKENSDCPSKEKGGDLGTFSRGRMVKDFEDAAFTQKTNEIGPVVETRFGYHVIQVLEHNKAMSKSLDEARNEIEKTLEQQKKQKAVKNYVAGLREKAKIVYGSGGKSKK
jgi:peptidyl-prolyl cis-trans isomerase C